MNNEERLHRIAALLLKGVHLYWAAVDAGEIPRSPEMETETPVSDAAEVSDRNRILSYIQSRKTAAPKDIRLALGISRATAQRRLAELANEGRIIAHGKTHALHYLLNTQPNGFS